jgi:hypothetical protein
MERPPADDDGAEETDQRLKKILKGAFSGPPAPLMDIPTRWGKQRATKNQPRRKRRQHKKSAA